MNRIHCSLGCFLSLGIVLVLHASSGPTEAQLAGTKSSHHLDAIDLQCKPESALDRVQRNDVGQGIVDATYYIELAAHVEPSRAIPVLEAISLAPMNRIYAVRLPPSLSLSEMKILNSGI